MKWWESNSKLTPVFTFDSESKINSNYVYYSHNSSLRARVHQGSNRVSVSNHVDIKNSSVFLYKTLKFNDVELILDTNIIIPDSFTFVLKVKVTKSSIFLSNNGTYYGLTYGTGDTNQPDSNGLWRIDGFTFPSDGKLEKQRLEENNHLMFEIVLQGDLTTGIAFMTVNGDKRSIPNGSASFNSSLRRGYSMTTVGHNHGGGTWGMKADVVAYGLFRGQVSDEELKDVFKTVDDNFLKKSLDSKVIDISDFQGLREKKVISNVLYLKEYSYIWNISEPRFRRFFYDTETKTADIKTINILYPDVFTLRDQVFEDNEPVAVKVFLYDRESGVLLKTVNSSEDGWFEFRDLDKTKEYIVRSSDDKKQFKSILKDYNQ